MDSYLIGGSIEKAFKECEELVRKLNDLIDCESDGKMRSLPVRDEFEIEQEQIIGHQMLISELTNVIEDHNDTETFI